MGHLLGADKTRATVHFCVPFFGLGSGLASFVYLDHDSLVNDTAVIPKHHTHHSASTGCRHESPCVATSCVFSLLLSLLHSDIRLHSVLLSEYTPPVSASGVEFSYAFDVHKPHTALPLAYMAIGLVSPIFQHPSIPPIPSSPISTFPPDSHSTSSFLSSSSHSTSTLKRKWLTRLHPTGRIIVKPRSEA